MLELDQCVRHATEIAELVTRIQLERRAQLCGICYHQPCRCAYQRDPEWLRRLEAELEGR